MQFSNYRSGWLNYRHLIVQTFCLNPNVQVKHINTLVKLQHPWHSVKMYDENRNWMASDMIVTPQMLDRMQIEVSHYEYRPSMVFLNHTVSTSKPAQATASKSTGYGTTQKR